MCLCAEQDTQNKISPNLSTEVSLYTVIMHDIVAYDDDMTKEASKVH